MLFLPEACSFIGQSAQETVAHASPLEGPVLGRYRDLAQRLGLWISCGGFQETSPDPARLYNTHVLLNPQVVPSPGLYLNDGCFIQGVMRQIVPGSYTW